MAEKTEKATPKKLRDARKKGQVAKAQDFPSALTFIVAMGGTLLLGTYFFHQISSFTLQIFHLIGSESSLEQKTTGYMLEAINIIFYTSMPIMIIVAFVGVVVNFIVIGPVFSFEPMKFNFKKLNPVEGIKQKFKLKVLVELLKSIFKITGAGLIIYWIIWASLPQIIATVTLPAMGSVLVVSDFFLQATVRVGIFFLFIAIFDLLFQKHQFQKEMKMEKFEIKQEYKDTEGDPQIKGRRRELSREIAYQEGPRAARGARTIITNPTHIAVAIRYNPEEEPAPFILTMGAGLVAEQIIKIGLENNIPIMRNVELARELYTKGKIAQYIPEDTYAAVAEILKWVKSLEQTPEAIQELFT